MPGDFLSDFLGAEPECRRPAGDKSYCPNYRKTSNMIIRRTLVGNKIVDHSDVFGASPVGAAPTTS